MVCSRGSNPSSEDVPLPSPRARAELPHRELVDRCVRERWRDDAFVPGALYEDGVFLRFAGTRILAVRPWGPGSGAWLIDANLGLRSLPVEPWLDLGGPNVTPPRPAAPILPAAPRGEDDAWSQLRLPFPEDPVACAWNEHSFAGRAANGPCASRRPTEGAALSLFLPRLSGHWRRTESASSRKR